ncbi:unnamed protein product [Mytilus coruscus]|uniref:Uncharacterized protein n=1 Tax=Mytilus coruscus TaxID=42192 RepID=A0A6J8CJS1_MYTCO|nr:unnamed protein product [Mytilus coruscus]
MEELRSPRMGQEDTLEGRVPQIEKNKRMASGKNIMDQYADFFLENEEDLEDSAPTPVPAPTPTPQQHCSNHMMVPVDDRTRMSQTCGMEEVYQPFEHAQDEEFFLENQRDLDRENAPKPPQPPPECVHEWERVLIYGVIPGYSCSRCGAEWYHRIDD